MENHNGWCVLQVVNAEINGVLRLYNMKLELGDHKVVSELFKRRVKVKSVF